MRVRSRGIRPSQERLYWEDFAEHTNPAACSGGAAEDRGLPRRPGRPDRLASSDFAANKPMVLEMSRRDASLELILAGRESAYAHNRYRVDAATDRPAGRLVRARFPCDITTGSGDTIDAVEADEYPFFVRSDRPECSDEFTVRHRGSIGIRRRGRRWQGLPPCLRQVPCAPASLRSPQLPKDHPEILLSTTCSASFGKVALDGSAKSTVDSVRRDMLTQLPVPLPPIAEQETIVARGRWAASSMGSGAVSPGRVDRRLLNEYKRSLITAAVTGELDVTTASDGGAGMSGGDMQEAAFESSIEAHLLAYGLAEACAPSAYDSQAGTVPRRAGGVPGGVAAEGVGAAVHAARRP